MAGTNDFLSFAGDTGANVITQTAYAALAAQLTGFNSGIASSDQLNKVWRQASLIAASLAQVVADKTGQDMLDDGTTATLTANIAAALATKQITSITATGSLTSAAAGLVLVDATAGNVALSLPAANTLGSAVAFDIVRIDSSANTVTVQPNGTDTIQGAASVSLATGEGISIAGDASAEWWYTGFNPTFGDNRYVLPSQFVNSTFSASLGGSNYQTDPTGLIRQWGYISTPESTTTPVTFPVTFPNAAMAAGASIEGTTAPNSPILVNGLATTGMNIFNGNTAVNCNTYWWAIGY